MPMFELYCDCGHSEERLVRIYEPNPACPNCGEELIRKIGSNIMVKIKGAGGYPSRQKQFRNTTIRNHPPLEHNPKRIYF